MDTETAFRNLVNNRFLPEFDYAGTQFSFKTVFGFDTVFSYCICKCGFEHEYLDYINDTGEIDEEKFDNILKCVVSGHCPHVSDVPEEFVTETRINAIHIAVAVGTKKPLADSISTMPVKYGGLYHLDPYAIAILKNTKDEEMVSIVRKCFRDIQGYQINLITAERSCDDPDVISFNNEKVVDFLSRKGSTKLLESFLQNPDDYEPLNIEPEDVFRLSLLHNFEHIQDGLVYNLTLDKYDQLIENIPQAYLWVIYYDKAKLLDLFLGSSQRPLKEDTQNLVTGLNQICCLLEAKQCQQVMLKHGFTSDRQNLSVQEKFEKLMTLLFLSPTLLKDRILQAIKNICNVSDIVKAETKSEQTWGYIQAYTTSNKDIPELLRLILDSGVDLNVTDLYGGCVTPMTEILMKHIANYPMQHEIQDAVTIRQAAELYLFENLDTMTNEDAVALGLTIDEKLNSINSRNFTDNLDFHLLGKFRMDGEMQSLFGHDDDDEFALNFYVPLFLECGFSFTDFGGFGSTAHGNAEELLEKAEDKFLYPDEDDFIHRFVETPRLLKLQCRDVLRKHFNGREIHRLVEQSKIPDSMKDFILLRPLLKTIPAELLNVQ